MKQLFSSTEREVLHLSIDIDVKETVAVIERAIIEKLPHLSLSDPLFQDLRQEGWLLAYRLALDHGQAYEKTFYPTLSTQMKQRLYDLMVEITRPVIGAPRGHKGRPSVVYTESVEAESEGGSGKYAAKVNTNNLGGYGNAPAKMATPDVAAALSCEPEHAKEDWDALLHGLTGHEEWAIRTGPDWDESLTGSRTCSLEELGIRSFEDYERAVEDNYYCENCTKRQHRRWREAAYRKLAEHFIVRS